MKPLLHLDSWRFFRVFVPSSPSLSQTRKKIRETTTTSTSSFSSRSKPCERMKRNGHLAFRGQMMASPRHRAVSSPLLLLSLLLSYSLLAGGAPDLASDRAALLAFRTAVGPGLRWNTSAPSPCSWYGVTCSDAGDRVTELRLPGSLLAGRVPSGTLGNLTSLRALSLRFNRLSGPLPPDLANLVDLRRVYLNDNAFTGEIPTAIFSLSSLVRLNLAGNRFSGAISPAFNKLTHLQTLYLENNQLSGVIPPGFDLPGLVQFNVSSNRLNGSIPEKLLTMPESAFLGNGLCGGPLGPCPGENSPSPTPSSPFSARNETGGSDGGGSGSMKRKLSGGAIAGIALAIAVGFLFLIILLVLCCRKSEKRGEESEAEVKTREAEMALRDKRAQTENGSGPHPAMAASAPATSSGNGSNKKLVFVGRAPRVYDLEDLLRASAEVLGKGTTGTTYKAMLEMGTGVAVKRLRDMNLPEREFHEKIAAIGMMQHPNLVPLLAYYYSKDEKLLVYEFASNGSLSALLHGNRGSGRTPLDWEARVGIALGAARGIEYIHSQGPSFSHGNIKSSNILLGKDYEPRVSDAGLCSIGTSVALSRAPGYSAPEVIDVRRISHKADVYSFGILMLELLTGKAPAQSVLNEEGVDLPRWVQSTVRDEWTSEVFDLELLRYQNIEEEMVQLLQLAMDCVAQYPDRRPSMAEVVKRIEDIQSSSITSQQDNTDDQSSQRTNSVDGR